MDSVELTKKLVEINSITGSEGKACEFIENYLKENGIETQRVSIDGLRYNIIARTGTGERKLILCSHFDTVPPYIPLSEKDGKLYGRGTCDAKCHVATAVNALVSLSKEDLGGELVFVGTIGEEVGGADGAGKVIDELGLKADGAIILEPMNLRLGIAQMGVLWANIEMEGKEMHITQAGDEPNVVEEMAKVVVKLKEEFPKRFDRDSIVGKPKFNTTVLQGGDAANSLPAKCVAKIDVRTTPNETKEEIHAFINDCVAGSKVVETAYRPAFETDKESGIVKAFTKLYPDIEIFGYNACTDANYFNSAGIPSVLFGCGDMKVAHAPDEYIEIDDILKEEEMLKSVCKEFLKA